MSPSPVSKGHALLGLALFLSLSVPARADPPAVAPVLAPTTKVIDPVHYVGRWYEVARLPNKIQTNCAAATSDWTRQPSGQFDVVQTCHIGSPSGPPKVWRGAGRAVDPAGAVIRIGYLGGFVHLDYRIMDRADDYSWCILTTGNPKSLWIMSKRPNIPAAQRTELTARAKRMGFDISALVYDEPTPDKG